MENQGWSGYYDSTEDADAMSGFAGMGALNCEGQTKCPYVPDLAPVGSGSAYFPRSVDDDASALNFLGFRAGFPGGGVSQAADMANGTGAWDQAFQDAVLQFQAKNGLTTDGWIGPKTRTKLGQVVAAANANAAPNPLPLPPQPIIPVIPVAPATPIPVAPGTPVRPNTVAAKDNTLLYAGIGVGVLAVVAGGYYLLK